MEFKRIDLRREAEVEADLMQHNRSLSTEAGVVRGAHSLMPSQAEPLQAPDCERGSYSMATLWELNGLWLETRQFSPTSGPACENWVPFAQICVDG
jgi:hypothetical protein